MINLYPSATTENTSSEYLLLDAARLDIDFIQTFGSKNRSLFDGVIEEYLAVVAAYLFTFERGSEFEKRLMAECLGSYSLVILVSLATFEQLFTHFQKFIKIKTEDGEHYYFRFYDPRVLKIFLPTCDKQQIIEFFGPVESFIVEGDTKEQAIRFWHENGELKQETLPVAEVFGDAAIRAEGESVSAEAN